MKKILFLFIALITLPAFAADKLHVSAMDNFSTTNPEQKFQVMLIEDATLNNVYMIKGDLINLTLQKVTDPTRAKRDAKIFFNVESYVDKKGTHEISPKMTAKYSKSVISVEEAKKIPPKTVVKKTASTVGNFFVKGFSYGVSFVDGVAENKENNRLKSGAKQLYEDSFLSYVEYGQEVEIKEGDEFYLIVKKSKSEQDEADDSADNSDNTDKVDDVTHAENADNADNADKTDDNNGTKDEM